MASRKPGLEDDESIASSPRTLQGSIDEETPLLYETSKPVPKSITPLPKLQLFNLMLLQMAEPITSQCITPFVNQLVRELDITGGDERKVGYYVGLIQSCFYATQAIFCLQWSMASDRLGRKPVLLVGLSGLCLSMILFGLSTTFWALVVSRCLVGLLNGNSGVMKSMIGEITDSTNMAQAFAWLPIVWCLGASIGPFIGGNLARPHDRWPELFSHPFWTKYPYFLPCLGSATFSAFVLMTTAVVLREPKFHRRRPRSSTVGSESTLVGEEISDKEPTFRSVFIWPVIISIANYGLLALMETSLYAILPLFYATSPQNGGMGLTPAQIGTLMGPCGFINGVFQALLFVKIVKRLGPKKTFMLGMSMFALIFALFPVISQLTLTTGKTPLVWSIVVLQLGLTIVADVTYGCIFMYITSAAPSKSLLGTTNGLGQVTVAISRACGPTLATTLFAASLTHNWLYGYAVYFVLICAVLVALCVANLLPKETWPRADD